MSDMPLMITEEGEEIARLQAELDARDANLKLVETERGKVIDALKADLSASQKRERVLREALLSCARLAEALKRECGMDPESAQAVRNSQYQNISTTAHIALGTIQGPRNGGSDGKSHDTD